MNLLKSRINIMTLDQVEVWFKVHLMLENADLAIKAHSFWKTYHLR